MDLEEGVSTRLLIYAATLMAGGMGVEQALEAAQAGADRVLLDNFPVEEAAAAAKALRPHGVAIELSGGLTPENVADYAPHGDCLSLGVLTLGASPVNFGLHVD